ncbi:Uncharacterised protein (plasmid) [Tsukamurella tyrosinosolvens]|uniref:Uncharacterized protein n=1 Tax=Tsukamurella tyrosinosolvens TaxID=57704 RepID=A0A1H4UUJ0_TSUTY|nr:hypothetical protein [Tsukamurella tyrosinosolvens]KXO98383.1 hypothetical protein AXK58_25195 [Tsukamurella tyrosinosolvens]SEC71921.1 hypothetical protein SAMN04489793_3023 [Tsukamurella tyrosinosolvens]VEH90891.1 Uncharacterised protein [Tsukamurella tyrosinosolvens]
MGNREEILTDEDIADIRREYDTDQELTDELLRSVLTDDQARLIHLGREWGWNDTEARDGLYVLLRDHRDA